jgi:outer membrane receptor protein involved in Fe transport
MRRYVAGLSACCFFFAAHLAAADIQGRVIDPSGAPVPGAQVSALGRVGLLAQTTTGPDGRFQLSAPELPDVKIVVAAPGFSTTTVSPDAASVIQLAIAPLSDAVEVVGSAIAVPASEQGGSVSIISRQDIERRNEPLALDLLRYVPGLALSQTGSMGGAASLFIRGGYSNFNLVQIDGVPVNSFGGAFDFAHFPSAALDHIEIIRGPQSAVFGPYANSGVIDFVTRQPEAGLHLDLLAEGGSHFERRFAIGGAGTLAGFGIALSASRLDTDGPVTNSDYHNQDLLLNVTRRLGRHSLSLHGDFQANEVGEAGPWGSNPKGTFTGIDTVSRIKNNFSDYLFHYQGDLSDRVRQEITGSFFLDNLGGPNPFGYYFNKDLRGQAEARTVVSVARNYTAAFGVSAGREEVRNSYITDADFATFPILRTGVAVYLENRFVWRGRLFLNAGLRGEFLRTPALSAFGFPASRISTVNPRVSLAYLLSPTTRAHASFATGMRPPSGFELAFTDNPALRPERTRSVETGIEQRLFHNFLTLDGTYFYNRFYDLIVTLGGTLAYLSRYQSANLANSRAQGLELSSTVRPSRWIFLTGSYTLLQTRILSLDGSSGLAPAPFAVGQPLTRRPKHSGSFIATFTRGRFGADVAGYFRGQTLFEEPGLGASNGLFWNSGFADLGLNLNYTLPHRVTIYGNLRNALNQHYEDVFGFPSLRINFVTGLKWRM